MASKLRTVAAPATAPDQALPLTLDLKHASRVSGFSVYAIRRLCRKGLLKYKNVGKWMIVTASLISYVNG
jgi:hypothetical protein